MIDEIIDGECVISFITEIELLVWSPENPSDIETFHQFVNSSTILGVDERIVAETIRIRKAYKLKLPDALIAAIAIVNGLTLIADNDKDFLKVPLLEYINPKKIDY
ncbi:type II toxin-antitoxin system VapC family toxin [Olivibacter jilunii]|uniref:type II toxin-antitoxin system VapC family toxin n=1 Tax=Olivibacter jilunii TaxID=985016 RepID=UPI003F18D8D3